MLVHSDYVNDHRVRREAETLVRNGYRVSCGCVGSGLPESHNGVRLFSQTPKHRGGKKRFLEVMQWFGHLVKTVPHDYIHAHDLDALVPACRHGKPKKTPVLYDSHELYLDSISLHNRPVTRFIWSQAERRYINKAAGVITVCDSISDILKDKYGLEPAPAVIRNMPDAAISRKSKAVPSNATEKVDELHQKTPRLLLYHGVVRKSRGLDYMLDLLTAVPDWGGVICGDGPLLPEIRERLRNSSLSERVVTTGHISHSEYPSIAEKCTAGLCFIEPDAPSYYYSLPNKLTEYIQAGLPVLGSRLPEIGRIIENYGVGFLIDTGEGRIAAGVEALNKLSENPDAFKPNLSKAASELNWDVEEKKLLIFYSEVAERFKSGIN